MHYVLQETMPDYPDFATSFMEEYDELRPRCDFPSMVYCDGIPIHIWWYTQKHRWFSQCTFSSEMFQIRHMDDVHNIDNYDYKEAMVIWWDQLMRHPFDDIDTTEQVVQRTRHAEVIREYYAKTLIDAHDKGIRRFSHEEGHIFCLLCLRHEQTYDAKRYVVSYVRDKLAKELDASMTPSSLWFRFFEASLRDAMDDYGLPLPANVTADTMPSWSVSILDPAGPSDAMVHGIDASDIYSTCVPFLQEHDGFCVSLSGGVDSMVLASCVATYCRYMKKPCSFAHINYMNREECNDEVNFLKSWVCMNFPECTLYVRSIDELQRRRETKWRTVYESITHAMRFQFYGHVTQEMDRVQPIPVLLGHNQDDCKENILTNLANGKMDNLMGMSARSVHTWTSRTRKQHAIPIFRPLLTISKHDIVHTAKTCGILYLKDSTPSWSRRGMLRDTVLPTMDTFHSSLTTNLLKWAQDHMHYVEQHMNTIKTWMSQHIHKEEHGSFVYQKKTYAFTYSEHLPMHHLVSYHFDNDMKFWKIYFTMDRESRFSCSHKSRQRLHDAIQSVRSETNPKATIFFPLSKTLYGLVTPYKIMFWIPKNE